MNDFQYIFDGEVETVYGLEDSSQAAYQAALENLEPKSGPLIISFTREDNRREIPVYDMEDTVYIYQVCVWKSSAGADILDPERERDLDAHTIKEKEMSLDEFNDLIHHKQNDYCANFI